MLWGSFFYVIFIKKIYIRAKLKECIFRQRRSVYIRANPFHLKLQNFAFCESCSSYKGGERWKSDPSVKSPKFFEGGGEIELTSTVILSQIIFSKVERLSKTKWNFSGKQTNSVQNLCFLIWLLPPLSSLLPPPPSNSKKSFRRVWQVWVRGGPQCATFTNSDTTH